MRKEFVSSANLDEDCISIMAKRVTTVERKTKETQVSMRLGLDGKPDRNIDTGIPFLDHMLDLFALHGGFDLAVDAKGDLEVDHHHTAEDIGLVLGDAVHKALGERKGIKRYGHAVVPMDETLASVTIDLSNRPFLVYNLPTTTSTGYIFDAVLAKEFFRALAVRGGMNLHINIVYGENEHHMLEAVFKALGKALRQAVSIEAGANDIPTTKGLL